MNLLREMCCCGGGGEDDFSGPYSRLDEEESVVPSRTRASDSFNVNGHPTDRDLPVGSLVGGRSQMSREERENDLLRDILEQTEHNIIDVNDMDGLNLETQEYMKRSRQYDDIVKAHDNKLKTTRAGPAVPDNKNRTSSSKEARRLLEDCGNKVGDWLSRPTLNNAQLDEVSRSTAAMAKAVREGIQVTHKQNLVVFMDQ